MMQDEGTEARDEMVWTQKEGQSLEGVGGKGTGNIVNEESFVE